MDYHSLAIAMSRLNDDSANNLENGTRPKWNSKIETFIDWHHKVEIWEDSHDIHLLEHPPIAAHAHLHEHEVAKRLIPLCCQCLLPMYLT